MNVEDTTFKAMIAIVCITIVECVALFMGVNGNFYGIAVFAIGGLAGVSFKDDLIDLKQRCFNEK